MGLTYNTPWISVGLQPVFTDNFKILVGLSLLSPIDFYGPDIMFMDRICIHRSNRKQLLASKQEYAPKLFNSLRQPCITNHTLVYQINVQHNLLFFQKNPTCMVLFHPAHFINFGNFSQFFDFYSNKIRKIPTCTALFHPAHFINFEEFSNLHVYTILHDYLID